MADRGLKRTVNFSTVLLCVPSAARTVRAGWFKAKLHIRCCASSSDDIISSQAPVVRRGLCVLIPQIIEYGYSSQLCEEHGRSYIFDVSAKEINLSR